MIWVQLRSSISLVQNLGLSDLVSDGCGLANIYSDKEENIWSLNSGVSLPSKKKEVKKLIVRYSSLLPHHIVRKYGDVVTREESIGHVGNSDWFENFISKKNYLNRIKRECNVDINFKPIKNTTNGNKHTLQVGLKGPSRVAIKKAHYKLQEMANNHSRTVSFEAIKNN